MNSYPAAFDAVAKKREVVGFERLLPPERIIYCIWWLEGEVNNGGFHQFFFNSSGDLYSETVFALEMVGATKTKALLEGACRLAFDRTPPKDIEKRRDILIDRGEQLIEDLSQFDTAFYEYEDDIEQLVNAYLVGVGT